MNDMNYLEKIKEKFNYESLEFISEWKAINPHDLKWLIDQAERAEELKRFYDYFADLYGEGLEVIDCHRNGDPVLFDNFFDQAERVMG